MTVVIVIKTLDHTVLIVIVSINNLFYMCQYSHCHRFCRAYFGFSEKKNNKYAYTVIMCV